MNPLFFPFFFLFSYSRGSFSEFPDLTYEYRGDEEYDVNEIVQPGSRYAFITSITGDDDYEHEITKTAMLAYTMWLANPKLDRILLISTTFNMTQEQESRLARLYTHVYFSPYVQFPCNINLSKDCDRHYWFKLNALTVTAYEKLLWVGRNIFIVRDVMPLFEYPAPAAPPDYQIWAVSEFGPVHNFDFFVFQPSLEDFKNLRERGCQWIAHPDISEERQKIHGAQYLGAFDNGLFEEYYKTDITTLPKYACYEIPGIKDGAENRKNEDIDPRIIAYRFSKDNMPWDNPSYVVSEAWTYSLKKMFEALEEEPILKDKSIHPPSSNKSAQIVMQTLVQPPNITNEEIYASFIEFTQISKTRIIINSFSIVIISTIILIFVLSNSTRQQNYRELKKKQSNPQKNKVPQ